MHHNDAVLPHMRCVLAAATPCSRRIAIVASPLYGWLSQIQHARGDGHEARVVTGALCAGHTPTVAASQPACAHRCRSYPHATIVLPLRPGSVCTTVESLTGVRELSTRARTPKRHFSSFLLLVPLRATQQVLTTPGCRRGATRSMPQRRQLTGLCT